MKWSRQTGSYCCTKVDNWLQRTNCVRKIAWPYICTHFVRHHKFILANFGRVLALPVLIFYKLMCQDLPIVDCYIVNVCGTDVTSMCIYQTQSALLISCDILFNWWILRLVLKHPFAIPTGYVVRETYWADTVNKLFYKKNSFSVHLKLECNPDLCHVWNKQNWRRYCVQGQ